jgi:transcriptional regulator with XRE-family HTH domain
MALELTQGGLADKAGLSRSAVVHYEQGNAVPGGMELVKLAQALGKSPNYLLSGSDDFFKSESPDHALADDNPGVVITRTAICLQALDREVRESVSALLMNLVKAKLNKREFQEFTQAIEMVSQSIPQMTPELETLADKTAQGIVRSQAAKARPKGGAKARVTKGGGG